MRRITLFVILAVLLVVGAAPLLAQTTVTEDNLLRLIESKAPEALIVKAISMAKVIDVDTSLGGTVALMGKGVSQGIVSALVERKGQLVPNNATTSSTVTLAVATAPALVAKCPQKDGVYYNSVSGWVRMDKAPQQEMSQNYTKFGNPFGRKTTGFKLDGLEAPIVVSLKPEFCVVSSNEISPREVMVVELVKRGNNRELVISSSGLFRSTKVGEYDKLSDIKVEKVSEKEIAVQFHGELDPGEYAVKIATGVYDFSAHR